jgi:beta-N-acetylhexosaminidase
MGFEGVILSDDLEMKAIAATVPVPDAAARAIAAGCDGLLVCSGKPDVQYATLERLVHAVEDGTIPVKRLEDALARLRRAKERTLGEPSARVATAKTLRQTLGCDAHRRVADEMLQFA